MFPWVAIKDTEIKILPKSEFRCGLAYDIIDRTTTISSWILFNAGITYGQSAWIIEHFSRSAPTSRRICDSWRWLANSNPDHIHDSSWCLELIYMDILFIAKVNLLFLIEWSYWSPQLCHLLSLWLTNFEHIMQSLLSETCLLGVHS